MSGDLTLALDAAAGRGTVAILRGLDVAAARDVVMRSDETDQLMPAVVACCDEAGATPRDLSRVVCGEGPGSFTSLRIAASMAKGIATAAGCPLFAVSSLLLSVAAAAASLPSGRYLSLLDAHRGELFALPVDLEQGEIRAAGELEIFAADLVEQRCGQIGARAVGKGQEIESVPHARGAALLLPQTIAHGPVDLVSWEPIYGRLPEAQVRWEQAHGRPLPRR